VSNDYRDEAITQLVDRQYGEAGDRYTLAGFGELGELTGDGRNTLVDDGLGWYGFGLQYLTAAGLCYRLSGPAGRAGNRAKQAIVYAEDQRDFVRDHPVERGICEEFVGDAYAVAGADAASDAYERAAAAYREADVEDATEWATKPVFEAANGLILHASRNTPDETMWDDLHGSDPSTGEYLAYRARYKSRVLPRVVDRVVEEGVLHAPRGSTEHNNDTYRCPECGQSEVNWVGNEVICLDCSVRLEEK
jgi:hypothetical protein